MRRQLLTILSTVLCLAVDGGRLVIALPFPVFVPA